MENFNHEIVLSVKDFQIVKKATLSFKPGLNAIIGQSNNGKTALFRAAKACIYNEPGTTSVRNGCSQYAVGLQMNGHTVICQKGQSNVYKIDGQLYQKIGRTQLPEVAGALGVRELNLNGSNEQLNFWDQMEKPFLLDRSETELFRFIVDSGKDNNITAALKTLTSDRQGITKEITMTEGMLNQAELNIKSFDEKLLNADDKLNVCERIIKIGPEINRLKSLKETINKYNATSSALAQARETLNKDNMILNVVEPKSVSVSNMVNRRTLVNSLILNYTNKKNSINLLSKEISSLELIGSSRINEDFSKYKLLSSLISKSCDIQDEIKRLNSIRIPDITDEFISKYNIFKKLRDSILAYNQLESSRAALNESLRISKENLAKAQLELDSIGICPTCGQPIHA